MVLKKCKICGTEFDAKGKDITCGPDCAKVNEMNYHTDYYIRNRDKWRWYAENARIAKDWGTGELGQHAHRNKLGKINFTTEHKLIQTEMKKLGFYV